MTTSLGQPTRGTSSRPPRLRAIGYAGATAALVVGAAALSSPPAHCPPPGEVAPILLPPWARAGFSDPEPSIPAVVGDRGDIVAILFEGRLHAATGEPRNKILWVSRVPVRAGEPLVARARLLGSDLTVRREVASGPGPSSFDLPQAGCWRLRLTWSGHTDTMVLRYGPA